MTCSKKNCLITTGAVFFTVVVSDFLIHQVFLKSMYAASPNLWRPEAELQSHMPYMFLGQLAVAVFLSWIFVHGYKGKGIMEGIRFGFLIGGLEAGKNLIMYTVAPYPCALAASWIVAGFAQAILVGIVASLVYKPAA